MKDYELALLISPHLTETEVKEVVEKVKELIKQNGGQIIGEESWGKKDLAYSINKENQGFYEFVYLSLEPLKIAEIEKKLKLENKILRYMICRVLEKVKKTEEKSEKIQKTQTSKTETEKKTPKPKKETTKKTKKQPEKETKAETKIEEDTYKELEKKLKEILEE